MVFVARSNLKDNFPPVRAYVHSAGLENYGTPENAIEYLKEVLVQDDGRVSGFDFLLAALWNDGDRVIDFFGFGDINPWPGNPDVVRWEMKNGLYVPSPRSCGDTLVVMGAEEFYRRNTSSLQDFIENPPEFHGINI